MLNQIIEINIISFLCVIMAISFCRKGTRGAIFQIFKDNNSVDESTQKKMDRVLRIVGIVMLIAIIPIWLSSIIIFLMNSSS